MDGGQIFTLYGYRTFSLKLNFFRKFFSHNSSHEAYIIARYFVTVEDQDTISCFLLHVTRLSEKIEGIRW